MAFPANMRSIIATFRSAGLEGVGAFQALGVLLYLGVAGSYAASLAYSSGWQQELWGAVIGLHVIEGILVGVEAFVFQGEKWWFSLFVIGNATVILFLAVVLHVQGVIGYMLLHPELSPYVRDPHTIASGFSVGLGLYASALMVTTLWSYFHLALPKISNKFQYGLEETSSDPRPTEGDRVSNQEVGLAKRFKVV